MPEDMIVALEQRDVERFWRKVDKRGPDDCWEWVGSLSVRDYGRMKVCGKLVQAHRLSYEIANGAIPDGIFVCHKCDNPKCVNPSHLWLGTHRDNMQDARRKGRQYAPGARIGEGNPCSKLTWGEVREIRAARGRTQLSLAREYNVSQGRISSVRLGKSWIEGADRGE